MYCIFSCKKLNVVFLNRRINNFCTDRHWSHLFRQISYFKQIIKSSLSWVVSKSGFRLCRFLVSVWSSHINTWSNTSIKSSVEQNTQLRVGYESSSCDLVKLTLKHQRLGPRHFPLYLECIWMSVWWQMFLKSGRNMSEEHFNAQRFLFLVLC